MFFLMTLNGQARYFYCLLLPDVLFSSFRIPLAIFLSLLLLPYHLAREFQTISIYADSNVALR